MLKECFNIATMKRTSFIHYSDIIEIINEFDDSGAGKIYKAVLNYVNDIEIGVLSHAEKIAFKHIKMQIDRDADKYEKVLESRRAAGRKGGVAKASKAKQKVAKASKAKQTVDDSVNDNDTVTDIVTENEKKKKLPADKSAVNPFHSICKKIFLEHSPNYFWEGKDGKGLNDLIKKIDFRLRQGGHDVTEQTISDSFRAVLNRAKEDKWINENFSITIINSKFNEITTKQKVDRIGDSYRATEAQIAEELR